MNYIELRDGKFQKGDELSDNSRRTWFRVPAVLINTPIKIFVDSPINFVRRQIP